MNQLQKYIDMLEDAIELQQQLIEGTDEVSAAIEQITGRRDDD